MSSRGAAARRGRDYLQAEEASRRAPEILIPLNRHIETPLGRVKAPIPGVKQVLQNESQIADLTHAQGGRDAKPQEPLVIYDGQSQVVTVVMTDGEVESAEMQDYAYAALEKNRRGFNFAQARENAGMWQANQFDTIYREALARRVARHKANPITDPAKIGSGWTAEEWENFLARHTV